MVNPGIKELQNSMEFELLAELEHKQIKQFVVDQLSKGGLLVRSYMIYQLVMLVVGAFIVTHAIILSFKGNPLPMFYIIGAVVFCVSVLIVIHEFLHGIAIKLTGAQKVNYGAYLRKFIFYAEADRHVLNKKQFAFIALTPLVAIKVITLIACIVLFGSPLFYSIAFIMCAHSFFCAGDIGLLSIFYKNKKDEIYTFDVKAEKKSYFFRRIQL